MMPMMVVPAGIPVPLTAWPGTKPAVLVKPVTLTLLLAVVPALEALAEHLRAVAVPVRPIARADRVGPTAAEPDPASRKGGSASD